MTSQTDDLEKQRINAELTIALMINQDERRVRELCRRLPDHALHILTIHDDTVLHMATHTKTSDFVLSLLDELPHTLLDKMSRQNEAGNTILHETSTNNEAVRVADKLLRLAPGLLGMRNNNGESALFRAARYGRVEVFNFLAGKISAYDQSSKMSFLQRTDKTTVLHMAILSEHYDLAFQIANDYKFLIHEHDSEGMTAVQLLACKPEAFQRREPGIFRKVINYVTCKRALREEIQRDKEKYAAAMKLSQFLIAKDTSWEKTASIQDQSRPRIHRYGDFLTVESKAKVSVDSSFKNKVEAADSALFLAVKSGCSEMVKQILNTYPQAMGYVDDKGRNILHIIVKYRRLEMFNFVQKMEAPMKRLIRKLDKNSNSILHMTGMKRDDYVPERMEGPALVLQDEIFWYERVEKVMKNLPHFISHRNNQRYTAEGLFAAANDDLRLQSVEWLKHTVEGCSVVAVLIATVAFAAIYTLPGGSDDKTGEPVLRKKPLFVVFTVTDVLSLTSSLASVVIFLSVLSSPFRLRDFKHELPNRLSLGSAFLFVSVCMMMIAFGATILLMIKTNKSWTQIVLYSFSLIPVGIFALSYFPVYIKKTLEKVVDYLSSNVVILFVPGCVVKVFKRMACFFVSNSRGSGFSSV